MANEEIKLFATLLRERGYKNVLYVPNKFK